MSTRSSLRIAAELKNLAEIRRFVEETATALDVDPAVVPSVILAVDEAVSNVIAHGYQSQEGVIEIEVSREGGALVVRLRDEAVPFDPTSIPPPDLTLSLEQRAPGGLGIHLIRQVMDEMTHRITPQGGNELTLVKRGIGGEENIERKGRMEITVHQAQGKVPVTVLQPHGDLDASSYRVLIAKAKEVYDEGTRDILLDLSDTPYMSSSGLVASHSIAVMLRGEKPPDPESGWGAFVPLTGIGTAASSHTSSCSAPSPKWTTCWRWRALSSIWRSTPIWRRPSPRSKRRGNSNARYYS